MWMCLCLCVCRMNMDSRRIIAFMIINFFISMHPKRHAQRSASKHIHLRGSQRALHFHYTRRKLSEHREVLRNINTFVWNEVFQKKSHIICWLISSSVITLCDNFRVKVWVVGDLKSRWYYSISRSKSKKGFEFRGQTFYIQDRLYI